MSKNVTVALDDNLFLQLGELAKTAGKSPSAFARAVLSDYLSAPSEPSLTRAEPGKGSAPEASPGRSWRHWDVVADDLGGGRVKLTLKTRTGWDGSAPDQEALASAYGLPSPQDGGPWQWTDLQSPIRRTRERPSRSLLQEVVVPAAVEKEDAEADPLEGRGR